MLGVIGGSGFENFEDFEVLEELNRETPFGLASSGFKRVKIAGVEALFLSRHGQHHELLPSEVNYRANIFAMKREGVKAIASFSAIGSLQKEFKPGEMVVPNQYIDRTKGIRSHSFCGEGLVGHVSLAHPTCSVMFNHCQNLAANKDWDSHFSKTYVCIEGPYFSTQAESHSYRNLGADIIGMTHFPEFALVREAGLPYLPCCFVTDYDCWDDQLAHVTLQEVIQVMRENNKKAYSLLRDLMDLGPSLWSESQVFDQGLKTGLMTPKEQWPEKMIPALEVLLS